MVCKSRIETTITAWGIGPPNLFLFRRKMISRQANKQKWFHGGGCPCLMCIGCIDYVVNPKIMGKGFATCIDISSTLLDNPCHMFLILCILKFKTLFFTFGKTNAIRYWKFWHWYHSATCQRDAWIMGFIIHFDLWMQYHHITPLFWMIS